MYECVYVYLHIYVYIYIYTCMCLSIHLAMWMFGICLHVAIYTASVLQTHVTCVHMCIQTRYCLLFDAALLYSYIYRAVYMYMYM